jgi:hypothetical protein
MLTTKAPDLPSQVVGRSMSASLTRACKARSGPGVIHVRWCGPQSAESDGSGVEALMDSTSTCGSGAFPDLSAHADQASPPWAREKVVCPPPSPRSARCRPLSAHRNAYPRDPRPVPPQAGGRFMSSSGRPRRPARSKVHISTSKVSASTSRSAAIAARAASTVARRPGADSDTRQRDEAHESSGRASSL